MRIFRGGFDLVRYCRRIPERASWSGGRRSLLKLGALALCLALVPTDLVGAVVPEGSEGQSKERALPFEGIRSEFIPLVGGIFPPPPPTERVVVGTLDVASGVFTWSLRASRRPYSFVEYFEKCEGEIFPPTSPIADIFDDMRIPPVTPFLDPLVLELDPSVLNIVFNPNIGVRDLALGPEISIPTHLLPVTQAPLADSAAMGSAFALEAAAANPPPGDIGGGVTGWQGHVGTGYRMFFPVRAGHLELVFKLVNNASSSCSVKVASNIVEDRDGTASELEVVVPPTAWTSFQLRCSSNSRAADFADIVGFDRPPTLGYFMLEAMPLYQIYEPPGSGSGQRYMNATSIGYTLKTFSGKEESQAGKIDTPFSRVQDFYELLDTVGTLASYKYPQVGQGLKAASAALKALWGKSASYETDLYRVTEEQGLSVQETTKREFYTNAHLGPGRGDVVVFMHSPVFAWLAAQDNLCGPVYLTTSLLGYAGLGEHSTEDLRSGLLDQLVSPEAQDLVLLNDPLTPEYRELHSYSPPENPAPGRFAPAHPDFLTVSGAGQNYTFSRTIEETDVRAELAVRSRTTKEEGGFLSYIAKNVPHTGERTITTWQGTQKSRTIGETTQVETRLEAQVGELVVVKPYYDAAYGTFAYVEIPADGPTVSGSVSDSRRRPAPGREVLVFANGMTFAGVTDDKGRFIIVLRDVAAGRYVVQVDGEQHAFRFKGKKKKNLRLRVAS